MLVDTHLHLVARDRIDYPWLSDAPALDRDWDYDSYERQARRIGISHALHMEVDVDPADIAEENAMVGELMAREGTLIRGAISSARPEDEGFEAFLDQLDRSIVKGIRRVLHVVPDDISQGDRFRANVGRLGDVGLPFDICMAARQLPLGVDLADACPNTTFVLDHCGVPDIAGGGFDTWAKDIKRLAQRPNVHAKISGVTAYAAPDWSLDTIAPYVELVIESFGWDRVVWGSDSPVCTLNASLELWVAATFALTAGASTEDRAKFFSSNAARLWSLDL